MELGRVLTQLVGDEVEHGHGREHRGRCEVHLEHRPTVGQHHLQSGARTAVRKHASKQTIHCRGTGESAEAVEVEEGAGGEEGG